MVLEVRGPDGEVVWKAGKPKGTRAISTGAAYLVNDILQGNTDSAQNDIWAEEARAAADRAVGDIGRPP